MKARHRKWKRENVKRKKAYQQEVFAQTGRRIPLLTLKAGLNPNPLP